METGLIVKENMRYFLKYGKFEHLTYGCSKEELTNLLGDTTNIRYKSPTDRFPAIYVYGRVQFHFKKYRKATFRGVSFNPNDEPVDKMNLDFNAYSWSKEMTRKKAIAFMRNNHIAFKDNKWSFDRKAWELVTEGGVHLYFRNEEDPEIFVLWHFERYIDFEGIE